MVLEVYRDTFLAPDERYWGPELILIFSPDLLPDRIP